MLHYITLTTFIALTSTAYSMDQQRPVCQENIKIQYKTAKRTEQLQKTQEITQERAINPGNRVCRRLRFNENSYEETRSRSTKRQKL